MTNPAARTATQEGQPMTNLYWRLFTAAMIGLAFVSVLLGGISDHNGPLKITGVFGILVSIGIGMIFFKDWRELGRLNAIALDNAKQVQELYLLSDELRAKVRDLPDSH